MGEQKKKDIIKKKRKALTGGIASMWKDTT